MSDQRHVSPDERVALVTALMSRSPREMRQTATGAVSTAYPTAPPKMIDAAVFHMYVDGIGALLDVLAHAELMLREPGRSFDSGALFHAIYHMNNLLQFMAYLPGGAATLLDIAANLKEAVKANDPQWIAQEADRLETIVNAGWDVPETP